MRRDSTIATLTVLLTAVLPLAPLEAGDPRGDAPAPRIYVVYEPVLGEGDLAILARVRPDLVCRGWFRWKDARDYAADAWVAERCRQMGVLLQGGNTLAALYPGENGIDEATFRDFATRGPTGELVSIADWYHVSLHNPKVREYLKGFVRAQIDAGAEGVWLDEIEGIYGWSHEGYDDYAVRAFAEWLRARFVEGEGWAEDDARFTEQLGIPAEMLAGGIGALDYRAWLALTPGPDGKPLAENPWAGAWDTPWESANPLYRLWGHAWRPDPRLAHTFQAESVLRFWREFVADARRYARERYGRELIVTCNENGTPRPFVDFQQPHDGALPRVRPDGRLDATYSTLAWLDERVRLAESVTPGAPVVQFVDWPGETDRLAALSLEDQLTFLRTYIAEAYAAGALFAPPVRGYTYDASTEGALPAIVSMVDFLRRYDRLLFAGSAPGEANIGISSPAPALRCRDLPERTVLHLIDHRPVEEHEERTDVYLTMGLIGGYAWTVALGSPIERACGISEVGDLVVPGVRDSALVVLEQSAPTVRGIVRDAEGKPVAGARVTHLAAQRTAETGSDGAYAFAGAEPSELSVCAPGLQATHGPGPDFTLRVGGPVALEGRVLDALGCPVVCAEVSARWSNQVLAVATDVEGRFELSLPEAIALTLESRSPEARLALTTVAGMAPVTLEIPPDDLYVGDFEKRGLWVPNDSEKAAGRAPVLTVAAEAGGPHKASRCMRVTCAGLPTTGGWSNAYCPAVDLRRHRALRFWYQGDGSAGEALLTLHVLGEGAGGSFYTFPLPLGSTQWREVVAYFDEFRREGRPPRRESLGNVSVQVGLMHDGSIRLWGVRAVGQGG